MKIIFLDFDGVLNFNGCQGGRKNSTHQIESPEWYAEELNKECVKNLNTIVRKTEAKIVVTSAWRIGKTINMLGAILKAAGFEGDVVGKTRGAIGAEVRGDQIADWLKTGNELFGIHVDSFVIIDDDHRMSFLTPFLVLTSFYSGLTQKDVIKAIDVLNGSIFKSTESGLLIIQEDTR